MLDPLFDALRGVTTWQMIIADQADAPRPASRHATLRITSWRSAESSEQHMRALPSQDSSVSNVALVVELQFFGKGAIEEALRAETRLATNKIAGQMAERNFALSRRLGTRNMTAAMLGGDKEERAMVEFELLTTSEVADDLGRIETVQFEIGTDSDGDGAADMISTATITKQSQ